MKSLNEPIIGKPCTINLPGDVPLNMIWIEPGRFNMGSPESVANRSRDELEQRVSITKGYWLGGYQITQKQWVAMMDGNPSEFRDLGMDAPVERVSWKDAMSYCQKLNEFECEAGHLPDSYEYNLPTEAQWEYACRAGTETAFYYGNNMDPSLANFDSSFPDGKERKRKYINTTAPVGTFRPNAWGLHDMHGNVWEWCYDWYGDYTSSRYSTDPVGPIAGPARVCRGGSWFCLANSCRSAFRTGSSSDERIIDLGFRIALRPRSVNKVMAA